MDRPKIRAAVLPLATKYNENESRRVIRHLTSSRYVRNEKAPKCQICQRADAKTPSANRLMPEECSQTRGRVLKHGNVTQNYIITAQNTSDTQQIKIEHTKFQKKTKKVARLPLKCKIFFRILI